MIFGHLAIAALIKHFAPETQTAPLLLGSVFPDIGDKGIKVARGLHEGRSLFHSLLGLGIAVLCGRLFRDRAAGRSWLIGFAAHLAADAGGDVPWLYPFAYYEFSFRPYSYWEKVKRTVTHPRPVETALILWALLVWSRRVLRGRIKPTTSPGPAPGERAARQPVPGSEG